MGPSVESIWCPSCGNVEPVIYDRMPASDINDHDATDMICAACRLIVATLHHPVDPHSADLVTVSHIELVDQ